MATPSGQQSGFITPDKASAQGLVFASVYGASQGIGKSGMSPLLKRGLPWYEGVDKKGRQCKYVRPADADAWRGINCRTVVDQNGMVRGMPSAPPAPAAAASGPGRPAPPERPARPAPGAPRQPGGGDGWSVQERIAESRAVSAEVDAHIRTLRLLKEEGKLLDREAAYEVIGEFLDQTYASLGKLGEAHAGTHATKLGVSEHAAFMALRDLGDKVRSDLERYAAEARRRVEALGGGGDLGVYPAEDTPPA